jgi:4'-phosphopantetheinyl transferase
MNGKRSDNLVEGQACRLPMKELSLPGAGEVHLWFLDLVRLGSPMQADTGIDPANFPSRMQRTLRRFYLRLLLGAYLGIPGKDVLVSRAIRGKPLLDRSRHEPVLDFSTAASDGCCLVGVSCSGLVGVDLEPLHRQAGRPLALARRYFSSIEASALAAMGEQELEPAFLRTWACKEAVVKAAGHGIANRLCRFTVETTLQEPPSILSMEDDEATAWQMAVFNLSSGHLGAVAARQVEELSLRHFLLEPVERTA